ncbi:MAG: hypothetical protein AAGK78_15295, partial [Planctomycetota bacterium]
TTLAAELNDDLKQLKPRSDSDILWQKIIGFALIPLSVFLMYRWVKISGGEYRLDADDVLHAPGHAALPADRVTNIDDDRWARKGISVIEYNVEGQDTPGQIKLDDFVYDAEGIHRIHDRLVHVTGFGEIDSDSRYSPGYVAPED